MRVYLKLESTRNLDMILSYDASGKDTYSGSSRDKKRTLTHSELLDKYYDEGKIKCFCTFTQ